jgi:Txe/YoeB family toxin of Txe-Axe toxin-antitoxin module
MKAPLVERVSNVIIREVNKWDGVTNHDELIQVCKYYSRRLAKRIIYMVQAETRARGGKG